MFAIIIDDEIHLSQKMWKKLETIWFEVKLFHNIADFRNELPDEPDIYIIDLCLGDGDGFKVIEYLRTQKKSTKPIMIISWLQDDDNIVYWLNLGADDYLIKPFTPDVFLARIKALTRRWWKELLEEINFINYKDLSYNTQTLKISLSNREIDLTKKEKLLLRYMLENAKKVVPKDKIIQKVWGESDDWFISDNNLWVVICSLRKKIWKKVKLETMHWMWYILK